MDTDNLSEETYRGIMHVAEKLNHWLTLQFGMQAEDCETENAFLDISLRTAREIKKMPRAGLEDIFWGEVPVKKQLHSTLDEIIKNCKELKNLPPDKNT